MGKQRVSSSSAVTLKLILKFICIIDTLIVVIPAKAGIHVFSRLSVDPRLRGGDGFFGIIYFEIGSTFFSS
jgi:hypothetical protein